MAAAAIPLLKGGSMLAASWLGKKLGGPNAQQKAGMTATQNATTQLGTAGSQLLQQGQGMTQQGGNYLGQAGNYYSNLLGSRSALRSATAPETATALDYYKGAEGKVNRNLRGGSRDVASAELDRQKVGQLAMIPAAARARAASGLSEVGGQFGQMGNAAAGQGVYATGTSATAGSQLFNQGTGIGEQQRQAGNTVGNFLFDIINGTKWGKGGSGGGGKAPGNTSIWGPINM